MRKDSVGLHPRAGTDHERDLVMIADQVGRPGSWIFGASQDLRASAVFELLALNLRGFFLEMPMGTLPSVRDLQAVSLFSFLWD